MPRPKGARNADFEARRTELATAAARALLGSPAERPSLRDLAAACDVNPTLLKHYFGDRNGVVRAAFDQLRSQGSPHLARTHALGRRPAREAIETVLSQIVQSWEPFLSAVHRTGLAEGLGDTVLGPVYVQNVLEPTLVAVEGILIALDARDELTISNPRLSAIAMVSPVFVALLHQVDLGGRNCRPLELSTLVAHVVEGFLERHAPRRTNGTTIHLQKIPLTENSEAG